MRRRREGRCFSDDAQRFIDHGYALYEVKRDAFDACLVTRTLVVRSTTWASSARQSRLRSPRARRRVTRPGTRIDSHPRLSNNVAWRLVELSFHGTRMLPWRMTMDQRGCASGAVENGGSEVDLSASIHVSGYTRSTSELYFRGRSWVQRCVSHSERVLFRSTLANQKCGIQTHERRLERRLLKSTPSKRYTFAI